MNLNDTVLTTIRRNARWLLRLTALKLPTPFEAQLAYDYATLIVPTRAAHPTRFINNFITSIFLVSPCCHAKTAWRERISCLFLS
jgi:hypothetical protein